LGGFRVIINKKQIVLWPYKLWQISAGEKLVYFQDPLCVWVCFVFKRKFLPLPVCCFSPLCGA